MDQQGGVKSHDGLLAYHSRPALFYPAVRAESDDEITRHAGFPTRLASGLGTAKFLCGACLALLGGMAVYVQAWSAWVYGGIWSGLFAIFTGLCIILAARRHQKPQRRSLLAALLVLSVLGFFNTGLLATFTAMGLVAEVYMEDVAGALVWRGVENASPFAVQLLLLATATADSLLSLACCVISGREVCCCGSPTPALLSGQRRERLISWLGSQQGAPGPHHHKVLNVPPVRLPHPHLHHPHPRPARPKTPSTLRVLPHQDINESLPSSNGGSSSKQSLPLVRADELGRNAKRRAEHPRGRPRGESLPRSDRGRSSGPGGKPPEPPPERDDVELAVPALEEKYFALDKKLSEDFIDRTWNRFERNT